MSDSGGKDDGFSVPLKERERDRDREREKKGGLLNEH